MTDHIRPGLGLENRDNRLPVLLDLQEWQRLLGLLINAPNLGVPVGVSWPLIAKIMQQTQPPASSPNIAMQTDGQFVQQNDRLGGHGDPSDPRPTA
jgi:hypothetical protein